MKKSLFSFLKGLRNSEKKSTSAHDFLILLPQGSINVTKSMNSLFGKVRIPGLVDMHVHFKDVAS